MASLTPGVLSKLLENAGNKHVKVTGEHRSALLQVIEIVPSLDEDPFRSRGFFLKLSDSLHSAYVSISHEDIDLIFSDKIQLGQFVYVSRFDLGSSVPVVCGLKVVPRRRPCVGSPKDLVSSDLLQIRACIDFQKDSNKGSNNIKKDGLVRRVHYKTKRLVFDDSKTKLRKDNKKGEALELRRLSLDSARRAWDQSPAPKTSTKITPRCKAKESIKSSQTYQKVAFLYEGS
ncbi:DUF936 domain-containing protein [Melia azedarach]|uniref:DUF936 domain-containing protein n=1 Tax=Melia azedarach TaxID=155640 RepID=A0ACC1XN46_MELAZ|nr:DUF936 domain-containing protein [Melia azedarach]